MIGLCEVLQATEVNVAEGKRRGGGCGAWSALLLAMQASLAAAPDFIQGSVEPLAQMGPGEDVSIPGGAGFQAETQLPLIFGTGEQSAVLSFQTEEQELLASPFGGVPASQPLVRKEGPRPPEERDVGGTQQIFVSRFLGNAMRAEGNDGSDWPDYVPRPEGVPLEEMTVVREIMDHIPAEEITHQPIPEDSEPRVWAALRPQDTLIEPERRPRVEPRESGEPEHETTPVRMREAEQFQEVAMPPEAAEVRPLHMVGTGSSRVRDSGDWQLEPEDEDAVLPEKRVDGAAESRPEAGVRLAEPERAPKEMERETPRVKVVSQALAERVAEMARLPLPRTVEVRLSPPGLGTVTVTLTQRGRQVQVRIEALTQDVRVALSGGQSELHEAFAKEGLDLLQFSVDGGLGSGTHERRETPRRTPQRRALDRVDKDRFQGYRYSAVLDYLA